MDVDLGGRSACVGDTGSHVLLGGLSVSIASFTRISWLRLNRFGKRFNHVYT